MFGYTVADIGRMLGLPKNTIRQRLRSMGYTKKIYSKKDIEAMIQDYSVPEGMKTLKQISQETGLSIGTLNKRIFSLELEADGYQGEKIRCFNEKSVKKILDYCKAPEGFYKVKDIAELLGLSCQVVSHRIKVLGIGSKIGRCKLISKEQLELIKNYAYYKDLKEAPESCCSIGFKKGLLYNE